MLRGQVSNENKNILNRVILAVNLAIENVNNDSLNDYDDEW
jgi:hypothetical protein